MTTTSNAERAILFNVRTGDTGGEPVPVAKDRRVFARPGMIMGDLYGKGGMTLTHYNGRVIVDLDVRGLPRSMKTARALSTFLAEVGIEAEICLTRGRFWVQVVTDRDKIHHEIATSRVIFDLFDDSAHGRLARHAWLDEHHPDHRSEENVDDEARAVS